MSPIEKFVIVSHGRTGSTTLCHAMSMHPDVQAYGEVFHYVTGQHRLGAEPELKQQSSALVNGKVFTHGDDGAEFCRDVIYKSPNEFGKRIVGFKIFFFHARRSEREYTAWRYLIDDPSIKVVLLLRKNVFDSYISAERSRHSGVWRVAASGVVPEKHQQPISVDARKCKLYMARTVAQIEWGRRAFATHPLLEIHFEDLQRDFQAALNRIFEFLGVEPAPIPMRFEKLNTTPHEEGIVNYNKIRAYFRFSVFREFFFPD